MSRSQPTSLFGDGRKGRTPTPVECFGKKFASAEDRRKHFLAQLRERLAEPAFRRIKGIPLGKDEDILALSDPPFYTACPNPFIAGIVQGQGKPYDPATDDYHREPFAADVSEGKNDPIYMAHSYHTKVPPKAIVRYILHYTQPGDVVLDGFSGSGMTGVAATLCQNPDPALRDAVEKEMPGASWGQRLAVLNDLSPVASFISYNYNTVVNVAEFREDAEELLREVQTACGPLYEVQHDRAGRKGVVNFTVWSEVRRCPHCAREFVYYDEAIDTTADPVSVREEFPCPQCGASLKKRTTEACLETHLDPLLKRPVQRVKREPVLVNYLVGKSRYARKPTADDLKVIAAANLADAPITMRVVELPEGSASQSNRAEGMTHLHHYYTARNFLTLSHMLEQAKGEYWRQLFFLVQSVSMRLCSHLTTYQLGKRGNVPMTGTLHVASLIAEANPLKSLDGKLRDFEGVYRRLNQPHLVGCGSSSDLRHIPDACIDYIFIDPPFGDNLNYAQLNAVWEAWLGLQTNVRFEAIVDSVHRRTLHFYREMLRKCLTEFFRVLKPGRWMTVAFHNSKNAVWNAIQEAIQEAGFVIADVRTLDKKQGTPKQINSSNAVKQDLIISAYKPRHDFEQRFKLEAGTEQGAWDFVESHLRQLPVFVQRATKAEVIAERLNYLLFDRMVAYHIQHGLTVPLSASQFYAGLRQRFTARDEMYFLPEQANEYDRRRSQLPNTEQLELFETVVTDEKTAIQWVRSQLARKPMTYAELQPLYMREAQRVWEKHEQPIELHVVLNENFVQDDRKRWHLPDPSREGDLEQLRHRALLREFTRYQEEKGRLRVVRSEALRAGFKECWQKQDYATIVGMAKRVPEAVVQEDQALLMYYDNALMRTGEADDA